MKSSEQIDAIAKALVLAEKDMPGVKKDSVNPHFKSKYASLDAVVTTTRPILAKHGLAVVQGGRATDNGRVVIITRIIHESGQWIESELEMKPQRDDPQGVGACLTYGRRYGYGMVGVVTDEDDDGNAASEKPAEKAFSKAKPPFIYEESASLCLTLKDKLGKATSLDNLKSIWTEIQADFNNLRANHQAEVTEKKDSMKADYETAEKE